MFGWQMRCRCLGHGILNATQIAEYKSSMELRVTKALKEEDSGLHRRSSSFLQGCMKDLNGTQRFLLAAPRWVGSVWSERPQVLNFTHFLLMNFVANNMCSERFDRF